MGQKKEQRRAAQKLAKRERKEQKRTLEAQEQSDSKIAQRVAEQVAELKKNTELAQSRAAIAEALGQLDQKVLDVFEFKSSATRDLAREVLGRRLKRDSANGALTIDGKPFEAAGQEIIRTMFAPLLGPPPLVRTPIKAKTVDIEEFDLSLRIDPQTGKVVAVTAPAAAKALADALLQEGWGDRLAADTPTAELNAAAAELSLRLGAEQEVEAQALEARLLQEAAELDLSSVNAGTPKPELEDACKAAAAALRATHRN